MGQRSLGDQILQSLLDCYQVVRFIVQLGKLRPREPEVDIALWSRVLAPCPHFSQDC